MKNRVKKPAHLADRLETSELLQRLCKLRVPLGKKPADTIRYWVRIGVIDPPEVVSFGRGGRRSFYPPGVIEQIRMIRGLQALGFTPRRGKRLVQGTGDVVSHEIQVTLREFNEAARFLWRIAARTGGSKEREQSLLGHLTTLATSVQRVVETLAHNYGVPYRRSE